MRTAAVLALCALCMCSSAAAMMNDPATACSKMPDTWKPIEADVPTDMGYSIYKELWNRYNASGLNYTWDSYMCEEPAYTYAGCYTNSSDGMRTNYMLYCNVTCTPPMGSAATVGVTADASWYGNMTYVYDVDLEYLWMDGEMKLGEKPSVWWEKNDEDWHSDEGDGMGGDDVPMTPPADMAPPAGGGY